MFKLYKKTARINSVEAFACTCYCQSGTCSCTSCYCYCEDFGPNTYAGLTDSVRGSSYSSTYSGLIKEGAATNSYRSALS